MQGTLANLVPKREGEGNAALSRNVSVGDSVPQADWLTARSRGRTRRCAYLNRVCVGSEGSRTVRLTWPECLGRLFSSWSVCSLG